MDVGRLDHEHITLPMTPGVTQPGTYMSWQPRSITDPDNPSVVDHLSHDQDMVCRLHDGVIVVVKTVREHRRTGIAAEGQEAAVSERSNLGVVGRAELAT